MKRSLWPVLLAVAMLCATTPWAIAQVEDDDGPAEAGDPVDIPKKWFLKAKGFEQAKELQEKTGADIFLYFSKNAPSNEKGLCRWFESKALGHIKIRKYLRQYIKVHVPLPSNPDSQRLAESLEVKRAPAVFIVQQKRRPQFCKLFEYPDGKPKLVEADEMIDMFRVRSSARYQLAPPAEDEQK